MAQVNFRAYLKKIEPLIRQHVDRLPSHGEGNLKLQGGILGLALRDFLVDPDLLVAHDLSHPIPVELLELNSSTTLSDDRRKELTDRAREWARSVVKQCEKKRLVSGIDIGNKRAFSKDHAVVILMVHYLARNTDLSAVPAIRKVEEYLASQAHDTADLVGTLVKLSWNRVEWFLRSRIYETIVACIFEDALQYGALVVVCETPGGEVPADSAELTTWLRNLYLNAPGHHTYIATERRHLVQLGRSVNADEVESRRFLFARIRTDLSEYVLSVAIPCGPETSTTEFQRAPGESSLLMCDLLDLLTHRLPHLEISVQSLVTPALIDPQPDLFHRDLTVWLMTQVMCLIASPDRPTAARCVIYEPLPSPVNGKTEYLCTASSSLRPNTDVDGLPAQLEEMQLLSGYASATHLTLGVQETRDHYSVLVSFLQTELGKNPELGQSCVAVPIPGQGKTPAPVMYLWLPCIADKEVYRRRVRCLQTLAPFVGELLDEVQSYKRAAKCAQNSLSSEFLSPESLRAGLEQQLADLLVERSAPTSPRDFDERLAVLLFSTQPSPSGNWRWAAEWLREQLSFLIPYVFAEPWLQHTRISFSSGSFLYGQLSHDTAFTLMLVPTWLNKDSVDHLRATLPIRLNRLEYAETQTAGEAVRLNTWMVDFKRSALGNNAHLAADMILAQCESSANVMKQAVQAYLSAYKRGELSKALDHVLDGLEIDRSSAYLTRRAAEYNLRLGNFAEALTHADRAIIQDPSSVSAHLLRGEALLGTGRLLDSLTEYEAAAAVDPLHPLPTYYSGQAILTTARTVRQWLFDRTLEAMKQSSVGISVFSETTKKSLLSLAAGLSVRITEEVSDAECATVVEELCRKLSNQAWVILQTALASLSDWGHTPQPFEARNFEWFSCLFSIGRTARIKNDPEEAVRKLRSAMGDFPTKDDLLVQELQFALMRQNPEIPGRLLSELAKPGTLRRLDHIAQKHQS